MKTFDERTDLDDGADAAVAVVALALNVMRLVRTEVRAQSTNLSVSRLRALGYLAWHEGASLSQVAEYVGVNPPTMSKLIDDLVTQGLVERHVSASDRRRLELSLTEAGRWTLATVLEAAHERIGELLAPLTDVERTKVAEGLRLLGPLLLPGGAAARAEERSGVAGE